MGLFDKKYCDVCGEKIGFLGNRKLENGNLCKDCAKKLSPFFSGRRRSTVEDIKRQLTYREENKTKLQNFKSDYTFGAGKKICFDFDNKQFIVTGLSDWRSGNPDIISLSQVTNVITDVRENKEEIFYEDSEGNEKSYTPPRYEYDYEFNMTIMVDSPWFDEIEFELSEGHRPDSPGSKLYRIYKDDMEYITDLLMQRIEGKNIIITDDTCVRAVCPDNPEIAAPAAAETSLWICSSCGTQNSGKFCENCGEQKPVSNTIGCASCGRTVEYQSKPPKFCPECGSLIK